MEFLDRELYRIMSLWGGLIPPEEESKKIFGWCGCGHPSHPPFKGGSYKVESASDLELELAARKHRWREFNKLESAFFSAIISLVTKYETDWLKLFGLPDIDRVRRSLNSDVDVDSGGPFTFSMEKWAGFRRIVKEWKVDLLGTELSKGSKINQVPDFKFQINPDNQFSNYSVTAPIDFQYITKQLGTELPLYQFYMWSMYGIGLKKTIEQILDDLPPELDRDEVLATQLLPQLENEFLNAVILNGGSRIRTKLGLKNLGIIRRALIEMADTGKSCLDVARYLHNFIGEGNAWYWHRLARSEMTLAANAAYNAQCKKTGINYDQWSAAPTACTICAAFDGRVWRRAEGPEPVSSTHPHCLCTRVPLYNWDGPLQEAYDRNPYTNPYKPDELREGNLGTLLDSRIQAGTGRPITISTPPKEPINIIRDAERSIKNDKIETAIVFDKDGNEIFKKIGKKSEVSFTAEECKLMKDNILTHNHPSGSSFSIHDIILAHNHNLREMRAVGNRYEYSFIRPEEGWFNNIDYIKRTYKSWDEYVYEKYLTLVENGQISKYEAQLGWSNEMMEKFVSDIGHNYRYLRRPI